MKATYNWLKDFVEIKLSPEALADKLTMAGLEVKAIEAKDGDFVFEAEVTSNRPDWLSMAGVAQEVAAITGTKLKKAISHQSPVIRKNGQQANKLSIKIEDKKDCPLYTAKIIRDVKVGPSPDWLKKRLELVGCRSVNNIVDITNYVLFESGEPLHAFDLDKIALKFLSSKVLKLGVAVRRAKRGEEIITIDGIKRILDSDILVIASEILTGAPVNPHTGQPIAIAGVMGGKDTEVTESTKNILLEAAVFNPIVIRRSRQKVGLQSESAYRFERGVDPEAVEKASRRAAALIQELGSGNCVVAESAGSYVTKHRGINLGVDSTGKILGVKISAPKIKKILTGLGFKVKPKAKNIFAVEPPSRRQDVSSEIDLIEEISRVFGYENIPQTTPAISPQAGADRQRELVSFTKNMLLGLGLNEAVTYSLISRGLLKGTEYRNTSLVEVLNPLSKEQEILRPTITPSLLRCVGVNLNQKQDYVNIFEISKAFLDASGSPQEKLVLGIVICGSRPLFTGQGLIKDEAGLLHLKGILETLFGRLGITDYSFNAAGGASGVDIYLGQEKIGAIKCLSDDILEYFDIKNKRVFSAEVLLEKIFLTAGLKKRFSPPAVYPSVSRDISLVIKEDVFVNDILKAVKERGRALLREVKITDYYKGKQIPAGFKGLTISCLYRSDDRTLTEAEINAVHPLVLALLTERFGVQIR